MIKLSKLQKLTLFIIKVKEQIFTIETETPQTSRIRNIIILIVSINYLCDIVCA